MRITAADVRRASAIIERKRLRDRMREKGRAAATDKINAARKYAHGYAMTMAAILCPEKTG